MHIHLDYILNIHEKKVLEALISRCCLWVDLRNHPSFCFSLYSHCFSMISLDFWTNLFSGLTNVSHLLQSYDSRHCKLDLQLVRRLFNSPVHFGFHWLSINLQLQILISTDKRDFLWWEQKEHPMSINKWTLVIRLSCSLEWPSITRKLQHDHSTQFQEVIAFVFYYLFCSVSVFEISFCHVLPFAFSCHSPHCFNWPSGGEWWQQPANQLLAHPTHSVKKMYGNSYF